MVAISKDTEEHVAHVDEDVGAEKSLPEIPGMAHLSEERKEEHGSSVTVDRLVETIQGTDEPEPPVTVPACCHTRWWCTSVGVGGPSAKADP